MSALHEAHAKAIADCGEGLAKGREGTGSGGKFKFRGIDQVLNFLNPILARHQLSLVPHAVLESSQVEHQAKSGSALYFASAIIEFRLYHVSGESIPVVAWAQSMDSSDKAPSKVMSIAYKYAAIQAFCIPIEDVADEGDSRDDIAPQRRQSAPPPVAEPAPLEFLLGELTGTLVTEALPGTIERYMIALRNHIKRHSEWKRDERASWEAHGIRCKEALEDARAREAAKAANDDIPY